ncbi:MAG: hypothetical protein ABMA14_12895 [Hyphomonadaceae bacterium]
MLRVLMVAALALSPMGAAYGQGLSNAYVFGEADDSDNTSCRAEHRSAVASVEAALRYNGIKISDDTANTTVYVNLAAVQLSSGICAIALELRFTEYAFLSNLTVVQPQVMNVLLCNKHGVLTGSPTGIQSRVNDMLRDAVDRCISEIEKGN